MLPLSNGNGTPLAALRACLRPYIGSQAALRPLCEDWRHCGTHVPGTPVARAVDTRRECYNMGYAGALEGI